MILWDLIYKWLTEHTEEIICELSVHNKKGSNAVLRAMQGRVPVKLDLVDWINWR